MLVASQAQAAELTLLVGGSMATPFREIGAEFARSTGNKLKFVINTTGALQKRMRAGEKADIIMISARGMDELEREQLILSGSRVELATAEIGVSVRSGAVSPDLSTPDAFKRAMLAARSIALVDPKAGGTSGIYLDGLFQKLGIADEVRGKAVFGNVGSSVADAVASGKAELGLTFISEMLPNKGVKIAGPLPGRLQRPTVYVVAIPAASSHKDEARAFVAAISSPSAWPSIAGAGLTPLRREP
ncbi:MAG: molybdate ABC transporter substrate-binding protein [Bryobacteraceae bacterium]